jgi:hypothetical protein
MAVMGVDISGVVECRPEFGFLPDPDVAWEYAIELGQLYCGRSYDAFGCLFGVMNFAGFEPVAAERGIPADAAEGTRRHAQGIQPPSFSASWISYDEIDAIDWDERAARPDARLHQYSRGQDGEWRMTSKAGQDRVFAKHVGLSPAEAAARSWPAGSEWLIGDTLYRSEVLTRRDAIPMRSDWDPVWTVMKTLASLHGGSNVRLVVWFDR